MKLAFVYTGGREGRESNGPSDFFYGARELVRQGKFEIECVDLDAWPADFGTALIAGFLGKWLPPRTSEEWIARCRRVLARLKDVDAVVATSTEISFGLAIWKALGFLKKPVLGILCGAVNYPIGAEVRRRCVQGLLNQFSPVLFADSELAEIEKRFHLPREYVLVGWFGVDETFWTPPEKLNLRSGVLAVGNDSRRDFGTLVEAARSLPDTRVTILTRRSRPDNLPNNIDWRFGDWKNAPVTDAGLRELYRQAACVVVPLEPCIQPSGQSVAMQAMMCGAPVVHTKTEGWWGAQVLQDGREVSLVAPKNPQALAQAVQSISCAHSFVASRDALIQARWTAAGFADRLLQRLLECVCRPRR